MQINQVVSDATVARGSDIYPDTDESADEWNDDGGATTEEDDGESREDDENE